MSIREKINDDEWYGAPWAEFFIAYVLAVTIQVVWLPNWWLAALLPLTWVCVHLLIGNWLSKHAKKDLFAMIK